MMLGGQILSGAVLFVTTPFIALGLGPDRYGLYTLLFLLLGYSTALDFGLSFALVKHVAEHDSETHRTEIDSFVNTATAVYAIIAAAFGFALITGRGWIADNLLHVPPELAHDAQVSIVLVACSIPFTTASTIFGAVLRGLLRFKYVSILSMLNVSLYSIGATILVTSGASLGAVVGWYGAVTVTIALAQWIVLRRLLPGFNLRLRVEYVRLRQLFGFGSFMAINQVGRIALLQLDRLVIARVLSVAMAGYYAVPFSISQRLNMLGGAAATVAFPHSSASTSRGEIEDFRKQHMQSARLVAWLTLAPTVAIVALADQILRYWMNPDFALNGTWPLRFLAIGVLWISIASFDAVSIEGSGRPWVTAVFIAITGGINIIGLLLMTPRWGLPGAAASVAISLVVLAALDVWFCSRRVTHSSLRLWARLVLLPTAWTTMVCFPLTLLLRLMVTGLPTVIAATVAGTALTGAVGYRFFLSSDERRRVTSLVSALWARNSIASKSP